MTSWPNHVLYISGPSSTSFLFSSVASFVVFDFSLNYFVTLIALEKKGNAVPVQTSKSDIVLAEQKQITSESMCTQDDLFFFLDRSQSLVCCFDSGP